jgi:N6-L-threonylcarbamoyladenine synthase
MLYLAIESSCDETSIALLQLQEQQNKTSGNDLDSFYSLINNVKILGHVISSQIKIHAQYGGVIPEIGARLHTNQIHYILEEVCHQAKTTLNKEDWQEILQDLDYIFVTTTPGLPSALRVGLEFAKTLQFFIRNKFNKEIIIKPINHLHGHAVSCFYKM